MTTSLPRLRSSGTYFDAKGRPTPEFITRWDELASQIESQIVALGLTVADLEDLIDFHNTFIDTIAPFILLIESRVTAIENRLTAAGIP